MQLKVFDSVTHDLSMCQTTLVTHNCVPMKSPRTTTHPEHRKATAPCRRKGADALLGGLRLPVAVGVGLGWRCGWWVVDELRWILSCDVLSQAWLSFLLPVPKGARAVEPARWLGCVMLRVDGWGDTLRCGRAALEQQIAHADR